MKTDRGGGMIASPEGVGQHQGGLPPYSIFSVACLPSKFVTAAGSPASPTSLHLAGTAHLQKEGLGDAETQKLIASMSCHQSSRGTRLA